MSQNNPAGNAGTGTGSQGSSSAPTSPAARPTSSTASTGGAVAGNVQGIHTQFPKPLAGESLPEGVDKKTRLFQGIDPNTHDRISVSLEGLKAEFGAELGEKKYLAIAGINGGSVFFNPHSEATSYRPPLGISRIEGEVKAQVEKILAATDEADFED